jgi:hypothetical protein
MKHLVRPYAALAAGLLIAQNMIAADKPATADPAAAEMMKKFEAAGTPGAEHKALEPLVGDWNVEVKLWMAPEAPPEITKGSAKSSWAMNGRFVQEEFKGEFMGKPFRGLSFMGYDNTKKKYNSVWMDDMHTAMFTSEGEGSADGKTISLEGKSDCPLTGQKDMPMKQVFRIMSRDKHVFEMYDLSKGEQVKTLTYTRK